MKEPFESLIELAHRVYIGKYYKETSPYGSRDIFKIIGAADGHFKIETKDCIRTIPYSHLYDCEEIPKLIGMMKTWS